MKLVKGFLLWAWGAGTIAFLWAGVSVDNTYFPLSVFSVILALGTCFIYCLEHWNDK